MFDTLATLKTACRLAVLTNKPTRATTKILAGLDLARYFDHVVGGDTPHGRKPGPDGLLALIDAARASTRSTVLVGDSRVDLETARRAGVRICLARYGFGFTLSDDEIGPGDVAIDHPWDLTRTLPLD
jgi:phosphoglycolate phosphatase